MYVIFQVFAGFYGNIMFRAFYQYHANTFAYIQCTEIIGFYRIYHRFTRFSKTFRCVLIIT